MNRDDIFEKLPLVPYGKAQLWPHLFDSAKGLMPVHIQWHDWCNEGIKQDQCYMLSDPGRLIQNKDTLHETCPVYAQLTHLNGGVKLKRFVVLLSNTMFSVKIVDLFAGAPWTDPLTGTEFVWVPGGRFEMGYDGYDNEKPVHPVALSGYWLGRYPVTQGEWKKVMGSNPSRFKKGDRHPVEEVSWDDVQDYISRLNKKSKDSRYRLPTEAEWEYAARSGGKKEKYSGSDELDEVGWYGGNSDNSTHPVGMKKGNGLGLHDMSGNVREWCGDWFDSDYYKRSPVDNPEGPSSGRIRVSRGGCWGSSARSCRTASRDYDSPVYRIDDLGFRLGGCLCNP